MNKEPENMSGSHPQKRPVNRRPNPAIYPPPPSISPPPPKNPPVRDLPDLNLPLNMTFDLNMPPDQHSDDNNDDNNNNRVRGLDDDDDDYDNDNSDDDNNNRENRNSRRSQSPTTYPSRNNVDHPGHPSRNNVHRHGHPNVPSDHRRHSQSSTIRNIVHPRAPTKSNNDRPGQPGSPTRDNIHHHGHPRSPARYNIQHHGHPQNSISHHGHPQPPINRNNITHHQDPQSSTPPPRPPSSHTHTHTSRARHGSPIPAHGKTDIQSPPPEMKHSHTHAPPAPTNRNNTDHHHDDPQSSTTPPHPPSFPINLPRDHPYFATISTHETSNIQSLVTPKMEPSDTDAPGPSRVIHDRPPSQGDHHAGGTTPASEANNIPPPHGKRGRPAKEQSAAELPANMIRDASPQTDPSSRHKRGRSETEAGAGKDADRIATIGLLPTDVDSDLSRVVIFPKTQSTKSLGSTMGSLGTVLLQDEASRLYKVDVWVKEGSRIVLSGPQWNRCVVRNKLCAGDIVRVHKISRDHNILQLLTTEESTEFVYC